MEVQGRQNIRIRLQRAFNEKHSSAITVKRSMSSRCGASTDLAEYLSSDDFLAKATRVNANSNYRTEGLN